LTGRIPIRERGSRDKNSGAVGHIRRGQLGSVV